jgi:hypothetical protein
MCVVAFGRGGGAVPILEVSFNVGIFHVFFKVTRMIVGLNLKSRLLLIFVVWLVYKFSSSKIKL